MCEEFARDRGCLVRDRGWIEIGADLFDIGAGLLEIGDGLRSGLDRDRGWLVCEEFEWEQCTPEEFAGALISFPPRSSPSPPGEFSCR